MASKYSFEQWAEAAKKMKTPGGKLIDKIIKLNGNVVEDPPNDSGWEYRKWTLIGFDNELPVRRPLNDREAVFVQYGDLLGHDDNPWRVFDRILYLP